MSTWKMSSSLNNFMLSNNDYELLSRLLAFFSSSYGGQYAHLKLIRTLDQSMTICSSMSNRLQAQIKCQHRISRLVLSAIHKQLTTYHDGGLYFTIIFLSFLLQFREIQNAISIFHSCLNLFDQIEIDREILTLNSIQSLISIVRSVICKSLAYRNNQQIREHICLLAVKSYLENLSLNQQQQFILTIDNLQIEQSNLFDGLIYSNSLIHLSNQQRTCLYFRISLAGDYHIENIDHIETDKEIFEWIRMTADRIARQIIANSCLHHGGLVLCQKVIHPSVKVQLRKYGIDTIDRIGRQHTPYFCYLTGCQPIDTLTFDRIEQRYFGCLTDIKQIHIGDKQYLQFINANRSFHTLVLCSNNEQSLIELKECLLTSHRILARTLISKTLFYGGGCSESMQIFYLKLQSTNLASRYLIKSIATVLRAQHRGDDYVIDRLYGHLWSLSDNDQIRDRCACELYSASERFRSQWQTNCFHLENENLVEKIIDKDLIRREAYPKYFDDAQMRTNAFRNAIETAMNIHLTNVYL